MYFRPWKTVRNFAKNAVQPDLRDGFAAVERKIKDDSVQTAGIPEPDRLDERRVSV